MEDDAKDQWNTETDQEWEKWDNFTKDMFPDEFPQSDVSPS